MVHRHEESFGREWGPSKGNDDGGLGGNRARQRPIHAAKQKRSKTLDRACCGLCLSPTLNSSINYLSKIDRNNLQGRRPDRSHPAIRRRRLTVPHAGEGARPGAMTARWGDKKPGEKPEDGCFNRYLERRRIQMVSRTPGPHCSPSPRWPLCDVPRPER